MEDAAGVHRWLKGPYLPPPPPVQLQLDTWAPAGAAAGAAAAAGSSRAPTPLTPPAASTGGVLTPDRLEWATPGSQSQQQQQPVLWPATSYAWGPSIVSRVGSSSFGYGHFMGAYIPSTMQQQGSLAASTSAVGPSVHALGQSAAAAVGGGNPLLASPVLPSYPMPNGTALLPAGQLDGDGSQQHQQQQAKQAKQQQLQQLAKLLQQHQVKSCKNLVGKRPGLQLVLNFSLRVSPSSVSEQLQQRCVGPDGIWLLACQHTPAEEVDAGGQHTHTEREEGMQSPDHYAFQSACLMDCPCLRALAHTHTHVVSMPFYGQAAYRQSDLAS